MSQIRSVRLTKWARVFWLSYLMAALLLTSCATKNTSTNAAAAPTPTPGDITTRRDIQGQTIPVTKKYGP